MSNAYEKVLYVTNTIAEYRVCFFEQLSKRMDISFLITHPKLANKIYGSDGAENNFSVINLNGDLLKNLNGIKNNILEGKYDKVVLPPADSIKEIIEGYVCLHFAKKSGAEVFTWTEKWEPDKEYQPLKKRLKNRIQRIVYGHYVRNATRCIVFGVKSREYIKMVGGTDDKIRVAHMTSMPPTEMSLFSIREKHNIPKDKKIIFCLARMIPRKGIEVLIDAMAELNKTVKDCVLILGGDGPLREELVSRTNSLGIKNILFVGRISPDVRSTYYAQSDVFVLPSRISGGVIEGWGLPVNEALFCGSPVIATTAVGSAYDMLNGKNGIMVEQGNCKELACAIQKIVHNCNLDEIRDEIKRTNDNYSIENLAHEFTDALEK